MRRTARRSARRCSTSSSAGAPPAQSTHTRTHTHTHTGRLRARVCPARRMPRKPCRIKARLRLRRRRSKSARELGARVRSTRRVRERPGRACGRGCGSGEPEATASGSAGCSLGHASMAGRAPASFQARPVSVSFHGPAGGSLQPRPGASRVRERRPRSGCERARRSARRAARLPPFPGRAGSLGRARGGSVARRAFVPECNEGEEASLDLTLHAPARARACFSLQTRQRCIASVRIFF